MIEAHSKSFGLAGAHDEAIYRRRRPFTKHLVRSGADPKHLRYPSVVNIWNTSGSDSTMLFGYLSKVKSSVGSTGAPAVCGGTYHSSRVFTDLTRMELSARTDLLV